MALNKEILKRLDRKTSNDKISKDVILEILQFESQKNGWYEKEYIKILEDYCKEAK